jgi:cell wall-associated NlpC family hydrolase
MAIDAVISRIGDIEGRIAALASQTTTGGIMGQGLVPTPADGVSATSGAPTAATSTGSTSGAGSTGDTDFTTALAQSLQAAGIDTSALGITGTSGASNTVTGQAIIDKALEWVGTPYQWGGNTKDGVDCSGLVKQVLAEFGIDMPRVAREQMHEGTKVNSLDEAQAGDLLVFNNGTHIGFYIGDGKMIDAPVAGDYVRVRDVYATPTAIRRVIPDASTAAATADASGTYAQTSLQDSAYSLLGAADLLNMNASSRTSFDMATTIANLGASA